MSEWREVRRTPAAADTVSVIARWKAPGQRSVHLILGEDQRAGGPRSLGRDFEIDPSASRQLCGFAPTDRASARKHPSLVGPIAGDASERRR